VEVVRHLEGVVPEDLPGEVLADPDQGEQQRLGEDDREGEAEQA
jgi:hypothetical protein